MLVYMFAVPGIPNFQNATSLSYAVVMQSVNMSCTIYCVSTNNKPLDNFLFENITNLKPLPVTVSVLPDWPTEIVSTPDVPRTST